MSDNLQLSAPWISYCRKINALFSEDPEVHVSYDSAENELKLLVDNRAKAEALEQLLPIEKTFGNIILKITIVPSNKTVSEITLFRNAFAGNPIVDTIESLKDATMSEINYVLFKNKVVQYFNDNLGDIHGVESTLYEDIAREIFEEHDGIFFNTSLAALGTPLGEWP